MAKQDQDLQPKDGDFYAYIEKMQAQKAAKLKESVASDSAQFAQELIKSNDQSLQKAHANVKKAIQTDLGVQDPNQSKVNDILASSGRLKDQPVLKDKTFNKSPAPSSAQSSQQTRGPAGSNLNDAEILKSYQDLLHGSPAKASAGKTQTGAGAGTFQSSSQFAKPSSSQPWQRPQASKEAGFAGPVADKGADQKFKPQGKSRAFNTNTRLNKTRPASKGAGFVLFLFFAALLGVSGYLGNPFIFIAFFIFFMIGNIIFTNRRKRANDEDKRQSRP